MSPVLLGIKLGLTTRENVCPSNWRYIKKISGCTILTNYKKKMSSVENVRYIWLAGEGLRNLPPKPQICLISSSYCILTFCILFLSNPQVKQ